MFSRVIYHYVYRMLLYFSISFWRAVYGGILQYIPIQKLCWQTLNAVRQLDKLFPKSPTFQGTSSGKQSFHLNICYGFSLSSQENEFRESLTAFRIFLQVDIACKYSGGRWYCFQCFQQKTRRDPSNNASWKVRSPSNVKGFHQNVKGGWLSQECLEYPA